MQNLPDCHICQGQLHEVSGYPVGNQVTSDCRPWPGQTPLAVCRDCGAVQKPVSAHWLQEAEQIYAGYAVYEQGGGVEQVSFDQSTGASAARSEKIVAWLQEKAALPKSGLMLDIGCGNGAFLRAFGRSNPTWEMEGLELDARNKALIESIPGVRKLQVGPASNLMDRFDLIVMVHALEHIPDPVNFLRSLTRLLNPGGQLLIEVPDLATSPFDILIADHCTHFSVDTLSGVVTQAGYMSVVIDSTCVTKELTLLARPSVGRAQAGATSGMRDEATAESHIQWLHKLLEQGRLAAGQVGVFGTSISGTWMAAALGKKIEFFVDEDPSRSGRSQLGLPIFGPENAPKDRVILMPLREDIAVAVAARLAPYRLQLTTPPTK